MQPPRRGPRAPWVLLLVHGHCASPPAARVAHAPRGAMVRACGRRVVVSTKGRSLDVPPQVYMGHGAWSWGRGWRSRQRTALPSPTPLRTETKKPEEAGRTRSQPPAPLRTRPSTHSTSNALAQRGPAIPVDGDGLKWPVLGIRRDQPLPSDSPGSCVCTSEKPAIAASPWRRTILSASRSEIRRSSDQSGSCCQRLPLPPPRTVH